jgi:SAM-dependent methyltransferase
MNCPDTTLEWRLRLREWFSSPLGSSLEAHEMHRLRDVLPQLYGTIALQLGGLGQLNLLDSSPAAKRIVLDVPGDSGDVRVRGVPEQLPFETKSVHVALLPHTLDFCRDPHSVLREVARVLIPEGHVIILGFNPISLWGLRRLCTPRPRPMPWCGNFFSLARIKDWLALLDFETTHGRMMYYRPPIQREGVLGRVNFLDKAGDRWWPLMAGVYMVVAKKRVAGVTPMPIEWKKRSLTGAVVARPVARGIIIPFERPDPKQLG